MRRAANRLASKGLPAIAPAMLLVSCSLALAGPRPEGFLDASTVCERFNSKDATNTLQSAIDTGRNVWVPNMGTDWIVAPIVLTHSDQEIRFEAGVVVTAKAGKFRGRGNCLFSARSKRNITLSGRGATFRMRKADYTKEPYSKSEWRHALALLDVDNVTVVGLTIENTGGDGIYVGGGDNGSHDVSIRDVVIDGAHRNGISVISAANLLIDNVVIVNTSGTSPQSGIDIEPNTRTQTVQNIVIRNSVIMNNRWFGITWNNHNIQNGKPATGSVENVTFYGNGSDFVGLDGMIMYLEDSPGVKISDCLFVNNNGNGFRVCNASTPGGCKSDSIHEIEFSAFWGNQQGPLGTFASLGTGSIIDIEPRFISTDFKHPHFMHLHPQTPAAITKGAKDGSYMGARGVAAPNAVGNRRRTNPDNGSPGG